jgi:GlpG protein
MHRALTVSASLDLRPLVVILRSRAIAHQITEESGELVVWTRSEAEAQLVQVCFDAWQRGELQVPDSALASGPEMLPLKNIIQNLLNAAWTAPVTVTVLMISLVVALFSNVGADTYAIRGMFFPDLNRSTVSLTEPMVWLRMITPAFLHFGLIHLVFNSLWLWYFGRMMEPSLKSWRYGLVLIWMALAGNLAQYLWSGAANFGGLSGVVYGQIGFIWLWQNIRPGSQLRLPPAMIMVFLAALVLMEVVASSYIASAAHAGGLVSGMLAGLLLALWFKQRGSYV